MDETAWIHVKGAERCAGCGAALDPAVPVRLAGAAARCLPCAGWGGLVFLPSGDPALTRRASTEKSIVVLDHVRRRNRNDRRGTLVEPAALEAARSACAADSVQREAKAVKRRVKDAEKDAAFVAAFGAEVRRAYPGCPTDEAEAIARHACEKHSGRVGRTAAAKEFDAETVDLAVRAHIRHAHTDYDERLDGGEDKREVRTALRAAIDRLAAAWSRGPTILR